MELYNHGLDDTEWATEVVTAAKLNALGFYSFTNLAAFPATSFGIGNKGIAEDTGYIYQNTGTFATPTWTLLTSVPTDVSAKKFWINEADVSDTDFSAERVMYITNFTSTYSTTSQSIVLANDATIKVTMAANETWHGIGYIRTNFPSTG
jgi:hypothetical protein